MSDIDNINSNDDNNNNNMDCINDNNIKNNNDKIDKYNDNEWNKSFYDNKIETIYIC